MSPLTHRRSDIPALTGLRGVAALWVLLYHAWVAAHWSVHWCGNFTCTPRRTGTATCCCSASTGCSRWPSPRSSSPRAPSVFVTCESRTRGPRCSSARSVTASIRDLRSSVEPPSDCSTRLAGMMLDEMHRGRAPRPDRVQRSDRAPGAWLETCLAQFGRTVLGGGVLPVTRYSTVRSRTWLSPGFAKVVCP